MYYHAPSINPSRDAQGGGQDGEEAESNGDFPIKKNTRTLNTHRHTYTQT